MPLVRLEMKKALAIARAFFETRQSIVQLRFMSI